MKSLKLSIEKKEIVSPTIHLLSGEDQEIRYNLEYDEDYHPDLDFESEEIEEELEKSKRYLPDLIKIREG